MHLTALQKDSLHPKYQNEHCVCLFRVLSEPSDPDRYALGTLCYFPDSCEIDESESFYTDFKQEARLNLRLLTSTQRTRVVLTIDIYRLMPTSWISEMDVDQLSSHYG